MADDRAHCPECGRAVATITPVSVEVDGVSVRVGERVVTEPGFAQAKTRHPSGRAWYRPTKRHHPGLEIKLRSVITCECGEDVFLRKVHHLTTITGRAQRRI